MKLEDAIRLSRVGEKVGRELWGDTYLLITEDGKFILHHFPAATYPAHTKPVMLNSDDLLADDWRVMP